MALFDSQYSLDQAYSPRITNHMVRPDPSRGPSFGKPLGDLSTLNSDSGLSSLMGPQPPAGMLPLQRIDRGGGAGSMMPFPQQQLDQYQSSPYGNPLNQQPSYTQTDIEIGDSGLDKTMLGIGSGMMGQQLQPFEEQTAQSPELSPPIMPAPVQPTMPTPTPMPTATPMPGDVGYVPYGSSNNQPFVQGLAGGGPIRNLSFVELLRQTMEN